MSLIGKKLSNTFKNLLIVKNASGTGLASGLKQTLDGAGNSSPIFLANNKVSVRPTTDQTDASTVVTAGGTTIFSADTSNSYIKVGAGQNHSTAQTQTFSTTNQQGSAGYHYAMQVIGLGLFGYGPDLGNGANPSNSYDVSGDTTYGKYASQCYWVVPYNIAIDKVTVLVGGGATNTGTDVHFHLMEYVMSTSAGTLGDLSSGSVLFNSSADIEDVVQGEVVLQTLASVTPTASRSRVILATVEQVSINTTLVNAQMNVNYHLV